MSQPTPKADQLRALREAKFSKRGKDAQTNHGAVRKGSSDDGSSVSAVVQHYGTGTKKVAAAAVKAKGKKPAAKGKKQAARKRKPAGR